MSHVFVPDFTADNVFKTDFGRLAREGARCVIFDADNTLLSYDEERPKDEIRALCEELKSEGFRVCILSNGHSRRIKKVAEELGLEFVGDALKPRKKGFAICAERCGCALKETVVVGDQIFTDVWGANRAGCISVLVEPIRRDNEPFCVKFKRILEKCFIGTIRKKATRME